VFEPLVQSIDARTRFCAVYGWPVRHSASPVMHNPALAALGLNWRYLAFAVHPDSLAQAIQGAQAMRFLGLNLTVPHKVLALGLMNVLDDSARTWGAVNTVVFEGRDPAGQWRPLRDFSEPPPDLRSHGFNTDAEAIVLALREDLDFEPAGAKVLVLGLGGAGRTAALKLAGAGVAELFLVNRTRSKAEDVAGEIARRNRQVKVTLDYPAGGVDLLLNATSLGLRETDPLPVDEGRLAWNRVGALYDMIYRPAETPLLAKARAAGCRTANGLGMLLYQGARALELWSGQAAPISVMRKALQEHVYGS
jgi:shikimate dehydrogenase